MLFANERNIKSFLKSNVPCPIFVYISIRITQYIVFYNLLFKQIPFNTFDTHIKLTTTNLSKSSTMKCVFVITIVTAFTLFISLLNHYHCRFTTAVYPFHTATDYCHLHPIQTRKVTSTHTRIFSRSMRMLWRLLVCGALCRVDTPMSGIVVEVMNRYRSYCRVPRSCRLSQERWHLERFFLTRPFVSTRCGAPKWADIDRSILCL